MIEIEEVKKILRTEMITIGVSVESATTGQMWEFDVERLANRIRQLFEPKPDETIEQAYFRGRTDGMIMKEAEYQQRYVRLADDQNLPEVKFSEIEDTVVSLSTADFAKVLTIMKLWIDRMLKQGWKKVEQEGIDEIPT